MDRPEAFGDALVDGVLVLGTGEPVSGKPWRSAALDPKCGVAHDPALCGVALDVDQPVFLRREMVEGVLILVCGQVVAGPAQPPERLSHSAAEIASIPAETAGADIGRRVGLLTVLGEGRLIGVGRETVAGRPGLCRTSSPRSPHSACRAASHNRLRPRAGSLGAHKRLNAV